MCAQVAPSGECLQGYKPGAVVSSRLSPRVAASCLCLTLLLYLACVPVFVVLSCVAACMYVLSYVTSLRLSRWINKGDYYYYYYY